MDSRGASPVIGTILMVAVVVVAAATIGVTMLGFSDDLQDLTAPMTTGPNLVENPGFEDGDAGWKYVGAEWNSAEIAEGSGVDGSNALRLQEDGYVDQELDAVLLPNAEYQLCAQTHLETASGGQAWVGVQRDTGGEDIQLASWEVTSSDYRNQCEYIRADREFKNITVWVYTEGDVSVLADDFVLQRTRFLTDSR